MHKKLFIMIFVQQNAVNYNGKHQTTSKEQLACDDYCDAWYFRSYLRNHNLNIMETYVTKALKETLEDTILRCQSIGLDPNKYSVVINARQVLAELQAEKHFCDLPKEEQEKQNYFDLKEMALYYGGWDELRKKIADIENNENEEAYERHTSGGSDAWSGGFAENH